LFLKRNILLSSGICWNRKVSCYSVPTTRHSSWLLDNGVWYWFYCCCYVEISWRGLYLSLYLYICHGNHTSLKTLRKVNIYIGVLCYRGS